MKKDTSEELEKLRIDYTDILRTQSHQAIEDGTKSIKLLSWYK